MFFYLSKIFWFFAQPSNFILLLMIGGVLLAARTRHTRLGTRLFTGGAAAFVLMSFSPLPYILIAPLEARFTRPDLAQGPPVTGLIILGGAQDGRADSAKELAGVNEAAERFTEGVALARRFPQAKVVFSGGNGQLLDPRGAPEAVLAGRLFAALGVSPERMILEDRSRNTWENAIFTRQKIEPKPGERWLLVTSAFHMARAMGCFRKAGIDVEPWPVDYRLGDSIWDFNAYYPDGLRRTDMAVREWIGLVAYYLVGHSTALFPR
ncbi:MAG: YdcF family protein [Hyphomicrobiales bacterium]|nr:MAG: YdcF family protein [Hyphomicrobiales bacterium]